MVKKVESDGFTLIELLVVISIIGLLSSIILASLSVAKQKADDGNINLQAEQIIDQIQETRLAKGETMAELLNEPLGNNWPMMWLYDCPSFWNVCSSTSVTQVPNFMAANNLAWQELGFSNTPLDPWGNPYMLDPNEGIMTTLSSSTCSAYDVIYSAGPDGIYETPYSYSGDCCTIPGQVEHTGVPGDDDEFFTVPFFSCAAIIP